MLKLKKFGAISMMLAAVLSLTACGGASSTSDTHKIKQPFLFGTTGMVLMRIFSIKK